MTGVRVVHSNNSSHGLDQHNNSDAKSIGSYRSTHTTRSSVLERAREYNRKIEQNRRSKSLERQGDHHSEVAAASETPRSQSAGRMSSSGGENRPAGGGNRISTRERAMASVQRESNNNNNINTTAVAGGGGIVYTNDENNRNTTTTSASSRSVYNHHHRGSGGRGSPIAIDPSPSQATPISRTSNGSAYSSHVSRPKPTTPRMSSAAAPSHHPSNEQIAASSSPGGSSNHYGNTTTTTQPEQNKSSRPRHTPHHQHRNPSFDSHGSGRQHAGGGGVGADSSNGRSPSTSNNNNNNSTGSNNRVAPTPRDSPARSMKSSQPYNNNNNNQRDETHEAVVTPELLVDALSGHEDGLLAIAERLMEHYDSGYDVMGEAIIDAFADVQKLFQHVVEAAHMEGAAFEASRREEEIAELRKQAAAAGELLNNGVGGDGLGAASPGQNNVASGPTRHDEFIDQDVKDILNEAIRKGTNYRNNSKYTECYQLYEQACQSASALLPVDSDHRGRLQLSIARAESMSHERACAILRYAMDDVLRSGLRAGNVPLPDPSQRADVVLNRPQGHSSLTGTSGQAGVVQSSEEALNSLVEEMREVMNAPVYNNTPLQSVASRFLAALADAQKAQQKNEEKLEQNLAKLKGDFLLARAEWEEKLNSTQETAEVYKEKYLRLKDSLKNNGETSGATSYLDHARSALASQQQRVNSGTLDEDDTFGYSSIRSSASRTGSHVSLSSGLANHARSIVGSFSCAGGNQRSGGVVAQELAENRDAEIREMAFRHDSGMRDRDRRRTADKRNSGGGQSISMSYSDRSFASEVQSQSTGGPHRRTPHSVASGSTRSKSSRSFREYSRSPQRVDF